jgi:hypothetical protein
LDKLLVAKFIALVEEAIWLSLIGDGGNSQGLFLLGWNFQVITKL